MSQSTTLFVVVQSTSALDNKTQKSISELISKLNCTRIVIAHPLSTIKNADRIAVINDGELVELGTHDELLAINKGQYKHLYEMQFKNSEPVTEGV